LRSAHAARFIHPFLQHTTDNYRPLAKQQLTAPSTGRMNHRARCSPPQFARVPTPWSLRFRFAWTEHLPAIEGSLCRHPKSRSTGLTIAPAGWNVNQVGTLNQSGWGQLPAAVLAEQ
jgi:hypothetical protein